MARIELDHGDHLDALHVRRGVLIVTSRGYPATTRFQRLLRRIVGRWI